MNSIFSRHKDSILDFVDNKEKVNIAFPLAKTGNMLNNYTRGDFIIVGGRKTSGKSSFILHNYVISPLLQKVEASKKKTPLDIKIMYLNTRKNIKTTIERMVVNYSSQINSGNKIGVASLYGLSGNHKKMSKTTAKSLISTTMSIFSQLSDKGILSALSAKRSLYEVENIIRSSMEEYGEINDETGEFIYNKESSNLLTIIAIDDVTGIYTDSGNGNIRNDSAHMIASKLRDLARIYNVLIVLAVPSANTYSKASYHSSSIDELTPYSTYADRAIILHNPAETEEKHMLGYNVASFIDSGSGICYLRTAFIAANYMGPSNLSVGYMVYPQNGFMLELPPAENTDELDDYLYKVTQ